MHKNFPHMKPQSGASLIETMVGLAAGLLLMLILTNISATAITENISSIKREKLNNEMTTALELITDDLRRAGYWKGDQAAQPTSSNNNPFMTSSNDITFGASNSCVLFSYDRDKNASVNTSGNANTNEHFGYRLRNNVIQSLTNDVDTSCSSTSSAWENITDPNIISVTSLSISKNVGANQTLVVSGASTINIRYITVTIVANLVSDSSISNTVTKSIRVRNDLYTP